MQKRERNCESIRGIAKFEKKMDEEETTSK
jgi:hypothetical protein